MATQVFEATVRGADGGFGMGQPGEWGAVDGCETIEDWLEEASSTNPEPCPVALSPYDDIYNAAGDLYRHSERVGEDGKPEYSYCLVYVREG